MRYPHARFTIGGIMAWIAFSVIGIGPIARYAYASPEGQEWWEKVAWLLLGVALTVVTLAAPYLAGFWDELEDRRKK